MPINQQSTGATAAARTTAAAISADDSGLPSYDDVLAATTFAQHERIRYRTLTGFLLDKRSTAAKHLEHKVHSLINEQLVHAGKSRMMVVAVPVAASSSSSDDTNERSDDIFAHQLPVPVKQGDFPLQLREYNDADEFAKVLWLEEEDLDKNDNGVVDTDRRRITSTSTPTTSTTPVYTTHTAALEEGEASHPATFSFRPLNETSLWHQKEVIDMFLKALKARLQDEGNTIYPGPAVEDRAAAPLPDSTATTDATSRPPELKKPGWLGRKLFSSSKSRKDIEITDLKLGWRSTASETSDYGVGLVPQGQVRVTAQWRDDVLFEQKDHLVNPLTRIGALCVGIEIGTSV